MTTDLPSLALRLRNAIDDYWIDGPLADLLNESADVLEYLVEGLPEVRGFVEGFEDAGSGSWGGVG